MIEAAALLDKLRIAAAPTIVLDRPIGQGGQGAVFIGQYDGKPAAIKLFDPRTEPRRIERELLALSGIDCDSLVQVLGHTTVVVDGVEFGVIAYEYIAGGDLMAVLQPGAVTVMCSTLLTIAADISDAVTTLWGKRIVHRDIKPANILKRHDNKFILADVGLARHLALSDLTAVGPGPGTNGFKSPEQSRGRKNLTVHSDIFSLGITLYLLASRQHPFASNQRAIDEGVTPRPLLEQRPDLPVALARTIDAMMAFRPDARPSIATIFREFQNRNICSI